VDRVGFDPALFDTVIANDHCLHIDDAPAALDYRSASDRIAGISFSGGKMISSSYVFDATNQTCFVARKVGVPLQRIGSARRVVFAHYRAEGDTAPAPPPWMQATSLLRLDLKTDSAEGLAWCIPLGNYVSIGISVDPEQTGANRELLLDWVDRAYATRGIDARRILTARGSG
jgi:hypothetical protein